MNWTRALFLAAASLDVTSTAHNLATGRFETNPLYAPIRFQPISVSVTLSAEYAGAYWLAHRLTPHHPTIAKTILLVGASGAIVCGVHNLAVWQPPAFVRTE